MKKKYDQKSKTILVEDGSNIFIGVENMSNQTRILSTSS